MGHTSCPLKIGKYWRNGKLIMAVILNKEQKAMVAAKTKKPNWRLWEE